MRVGVALAIALSLGLAAPAFSQERELALGVAEFARVAPKGQGVPDVASRLAQRLSTKGIPKVVGPAELGAPAQAVPEADQVAEWGERAGVEAIVVGRTTRLGNTLSVDARILDAATGVEVGDPLVEEVNRPSDLGRAIEGLATQVVERIEADPMLPQVAARKPAGSPAARAAAASPKKRFADSPISIKADELEAFDASGKKKFVFTGKVRAIQEDLLLRSDRLEAFYPPGGSQPERLVATGHVVLEQEGRTAYCEKAIFYRADDRMECMGNNALLEQKCDEVRGKKITFQMDTEVMHVEGAADVKLRPDNPNCAAPAPAPKSAAASRGTGR